MRDRIADVARKKYGIKNLLLDYIHRFTYPTKSQNLPV
jgi:hypothetical protein